MYLISLKVVVDILPYGSNVILISTGREKRSEEK